MDVGSRGSYPSNALSNFAPHAFVLDGVRCASCEGFLQSLKFKDPDMQEVVCTYVGRKAKAAGSKKNWETKGVLYWRGKAIDRFGDEYQILLDRAYLEMAKQSLSFRKALFASHNATLTHSIGKNKESDTILTEREFCSRLMKIRKLLQEDKIPFVGGSIDESKASD